MFDPLAILRLAFLGAIVLGAKGAKRQGGHDTPSLDGRAVQNTVNGWVNWVNEA